MSRCLAGAPHDGLDFLHAITMHPAVVVALKGIRFFWFLHCWMVLGAVNGKYVGGWPGLKPAGDVGE